MEQPHLTVRAMQHHDIDRIVQYWMNSDPAFLQSMGVDLNKLPTREQFTNMLAGQLELPVADKRSFCIIWEVDGKAAGHCNTNPTVFGKEAFMHLHLWNSTTRQNGLGYRLVQMTLPLFFEQLLLRTLYCEPYALNTAPNKTLEKLGFQLEKEYTTIPGPLNFEQPVKRWYMSRERFEQLYSFS
jgi:RimJ/RimL family protein N-acetyltransferase